MIANRGLHVVHMGWRTVAISFDVTIQRVGGRLFDYDRRILVNGLRARFAAWQDRLIAAIGLLIMLGGLREWFTDRPWTLAAPVGLIAAGICGLSSGRAISSRLVFHAFDGPLAADAIRLPTCKRYMIAWHAMGLAILATITLIARPSLLIAVLPGYVTGAIIGGRTFGFGLSGLFAKWRGNGWRTQSWTRHPHAGIVCAAFLCLTLPLANFVGIGAIVIVVVIEATMLALALTAVDDGIVRFLTLAGIVLGASSLVRRVEPRCSRERLRLSAPLSWALSLVRSSRASLLRLYC